MTTIEKIDDLIVQATTERSHYYTASVLREARGEIELLTRRAELAESAVDVLEKSHASLARQLADEHRENEGLRDLALAMLAAVDCFGDQPIMAWRGAIVAALATKSQSGG